MEAALAEVATKFSSLEAKERELEVQERALAKKK